MVGNYSKWIIGPNSEFGITEFSVLALYTIMDICRRGL